MRKKPLSITLGDYDRELLDGIAAANDRSLSYMVGWAIQRFAKDDGGHGDGLDPRLLKQINKKHGMEDDE